MPELKNQYLLGSVNRHNMDARKRVFIPARIREVLGKDLVISNDVVRDRECLCIYSEENWNARVERLLEFCESEEERQETLHVLCNCMIPAELDEQGRVTLTKQLTDYAMLEKEVVITGAGDHAVMWASAVYEEMNAKVDEKAALKAILGRRRS